jgi:hypothetical protein
MADPLFGELPSKYNFESLFQVYCKSSVEIDNFSNVIAQMNTLTELCQDALSNVAVEEIDAVLELLPKNPTTITTHLIYAVQILQQRQSISDKNLGPILQQMTESKPLSD